MIIHFYVFSLRRTIIIIITRNSGTPKEHGRSKNNTSWMRFECGGGSDPFVSFELLTAISLSLGIAWQWLVIRSHLHISPSFLPFPCTHFTLSFSLLPISTVSIYITSPSRGGNAPLPAPRQRCLYLIRIASMTATRPSIFMNAPHSYPPPPITEAVPTMMTSTSTDRTPPLPDRPGSPVSDCW